MDVKLCYLLLTILVVVNGERKKSGHTKGIQAEAELQNARTKRFRFFKSRLITIYGPAWSKRSKENKVKFGQTDGELPVSHDKDDPTEYLPVLEVPMNLSKRGSDKTFATIELLLVIDYNIFLSYLEKHSNVVKATAKLKEYYEHFVGYLSEIYERAANSFSITIRPVAIVMAVDPDASRWAGVGRIFSRARNADVIPAKRALKMFSLWLQRHKKKLPEFDHAMAVTNSALYDKVPHDGLRGMAWVKGMCRKSKDRVDSASIITDLGAFQGVLTAAHELGHSLGAPHDGNAKYASWCPEADRYLMSPTLPRSVDVARFSSCSEFVIKHRFRIQKYPCLMDHILTHSHPQVKLTHHPGSRYDANELCTQWFGRNYRACHLLASIDLYRPMCSGMLMCGRKDIEMVCDKQDTVPTGTPCGTRSVCRDHRCVHESKSPCCPLRDEDHNYCTRKMRESHENCNNPNMKFLCCRHCGTKC